MFCPRSDTLTSTHSHWPELVTWQTCDVHSCACNKWRNGYWGALGGCTAPSYSEGQNPPLKTKSSNEGHWSFCKTPLYLKPFSHSHSIRWNSWISNRYWITNSSQAFAMSGTLLCSLIHYLIYLVQQIFKVGFIIPIWQMKKLSLKECPSLDFSRIRPRGKDLDTRKPSEGGGLW